MTEREAPAETAAPGALLPVATGRGVGAYLWRTLPGKRWRFAGILALFLVEAGAALVFPLVTGAVVDTVLAAAGMGVPTAFWGLIALLLAAAVAAGLLAWVGGVLLAQMVETVVADLREDYVAAALALPRADIERAGTGDVVTRASEDIAQISQSLPDALPRVAVSAFTILLVAAGLGTLNPWYLAGFALTVPLYAGTVRWYLRVAPAVYAAERVAQSRRGQQILGTLNALPAVTAHRLEQRQLGRIRAAAWETVRRAMRARIVQNRLFGRLNLTEA
ncbi:ABC transporter transmembrane domain-containing protein, partial [Leucobacter sp. M11]|uniref:ABC transporter transmembrane domain-containing protein n=1 Tax=Leucobacter sp. M11 TaxID=2993565 RepID=UPI002D7F93E7